MILRTVPSKDEFAFRGTNEILLLVIGARCLVAVGMMTI